MATASAARPDQQFLVIVPGAIPAVHRIGRPADAHALPFPEQYVVAAIAAASGGPGAEIAGPSGSDAVVVRAHTQRATPTGRPGTYKNRCRYFLPLLLPLDYPLAMRIAEDHILGKSETTTWV